MPAASSEYSGLGSRRVRKNCLDKQGRSHYKYLKNNEKHRRILPQEPDSLIVCEGLPQEPTALSSGEARQRQTFGIRTLGRHQGISSHKNADLADLLVISSSFRRYEEAVAKWLTHLGPAAQRGMDEVAKAQVASFRDTLLALSSPATTNHALKIVRMVFRSARREGFLFVHRPWLGEPYHRALAAGRS